MVSDPIFFEDVEIWDPSTPPMIEYPMDAPGCTIPVDAASGQWGAFVLVEALLLRYHRADGARVGFGDQENATFDLEFSPRISAGFLNPHGLGLRARWWQYDHSASIPEANGGALNVDTYTLDLELVKLLSLGSRLAFEFSGGLRYNDFEEIMTDNSPNPAFNDRRTNSFDGYGLELGLETTANVYNSLNVYGRIRYAALMNDKTVTNSGGVFIGGTGSEIVPQQAVLRDVVLGQLELAAGIELSRGTHAGRLFVRAGVEYQVWYDYSTSFSLVDVTVPPAPFVGDFLEFLGGPSNVGFGGLGLAVGLSR